MISKLISILLYLFFLFWVIFALIWFLRDSPYRYLYGTMGMFYSLAFFISAHFLKKKPWAWRLAIISAGSSILISIFDQIGWIDLAYIVSAIALLTTLLKKS